MIDTQYKDLLKDILENGVRKTNRTGVDTISVFGRQIYHDMEDGFPVLTTKKMAWKSIVTELLWFLSGDTNIKYLVDNGCHIWDGDSFKRYKNTDPDHLANDEMFKTETGSYKLFTQEQFINKIKTDDEFAKRWGEMGKIYGHQWRNWETHVAIPTTLKIDDGDDIEPLYVKGTRYIDQIQNLIDDIKTNPDSRRLMVSAWNPADLKEMVLPPCHYGFQVYTRELTWEERRDNIIFKQMKGWTKKSTTKQLRKLIEKSPRRAISLMFNMRSNDVPLGLPFNIASYALLLEIIGRMVNMIPDQVIASLGDAHIYVNQIDGINKQLSRDPYPLPKLIISDDVDFSGNIDDFLNSCDKDSFKLENYKSHPAIKIPLSN